MASIYEMLIGAPPSGPEQTASAARALRGQSQLGTLGMVTGDPVLSNIGKGMVGQAQRRAEGLQQARQRAIMEQRERDRMSAQEAQWAEANRLREEQLKQTRWWREQQLKEQEKEKQLKIPPTTVQKDARSVVDSALYTKALLDDFKPEYGAGTLGVVGGGTVERWLGGKAVGTKSQQEMADWWKRYDRLYTLPTRNKMFGSALTEHEKAAWEAANISANSPPEVIIKTLKDLTAIATAASLRMRDDLKTIYDNDWVNEAFSHVSTTNPEVVPKGQSDTVTPTLHQSSSGYSYEYVNED